MKVKEILKMLEVYKPDDELCVLYWDKPQFDNLDEMVLTDESWARICKEFDEWDNAGSEITQWIFDSALDYADQKELPDA